VKTETDLGELLVDESPDAIIVTAGDGRTLFWNRGAEEIFGYARAEVLDHRLRELIVPSERAQEEDRVLAETIANGHSTQQTIRRRRDGALIPVDIIRKTVRLPDGGSPVVMSVIRDITERDRLEQVLRGKNAELQRSSQAKDRFLSAMSHDLRTPLNAVIGFTTTLLMKLPGPLTGEQEKQLKMIQSSAMRLLDLIKDLLDTAKIEAASVEPQRVSTRCVELVVEVADSLRPLAQARGLTLSVVAPAEELSAHVDRRSLTQIVLNLVNDAIKFSERGGILIRVLSAAREDRRTIEISVEDTGSARAEERERASLGLQVSRKLAASLGGRIVVQGDPGKGSILTVVLPHE
jgi:protein-histidine pros-kinase